MQRFQVHFEVTRLSNGRYMAVCPLLEGCHAEGRTEAEAIAKAEDVAKSIIEMRSPFAVLVHAHPSPPKAKSRCPIL